MDNSSLSISELLLKRLEQLATCTPLPEETVETEAIPTLAAATTDTIYSKVMEEAPNRKAAQRAYAPVETSEPHSLGSG